MIIIAKKKQTETKQTECVCRDARKNSDDDDSKNKMTTQTVRRERKRIMVSSPAKKKKKKTSAHDHGLADNRKRKGNSRGFSQTK